MSANATKKLTKDFGIAAAHIKPGEKELQVTDYSSMGINSVEGYPFEIGKVGIHECIYDERKKIARRIMEDGTEINVENTVMFKKIADKIKNNKGIDRA